MSVSADFEGLQVTVVLSKLGSSSDDVVDGDGSSVPDVDGIKVRLFSEWFDCSCTSEVFGDETLPFEKAAENNVKAARFVASFKQPSMSVSNKDQLQLLNLKPFIYAVFLTKTGPLSFIPIDCSSFLLEKNKLCV